MQLDVHAKFVLTKPTQDQDRSAKWGISFPHDSLFLLVDLQITLIHSYLRTPVRSMVNHDCMLFLALLIFFSDVYDTRSSTEILGYGKVRTGRRPLADI